MIQVITPLFNLIYFEMKHIDYNGLIEFIQLNLTKDLLKGRCKIQEHKLDGHCYVGAESLYHLIDKKNYNIYYYVYTDEFGRATHWWLQHKENHIILDPTKEQYTDAGLTPPYHLKKRGVFLTKLPSKRAKIVIDRVVAQMQENHYFNPFICE